jgi:salicylate hydroxylase
VVGGGIGGLAASISLRNAGHQVLVLEQVEQLSEIGAGIGMAPNAVHALRKLGAADRLEPLAAKPSQWQRRQWSDGDVFAAIPLSDAVVERFGDEFWTIHRGDMHAALLAEARRDSESIDVRVGVQVVEFSPESGTVATSAGEVFGADLIVAADGVRSAAIAAIGLNAPPVFSGNIAYRVQFSVEELAALGGLDEFIENAELQSWLGPNGHVVMMTIRGGSMLNCTICLTEPSQISGSWSSPAEVSEVVARLEGWYPPLVRMIGHAKQTFRWDLYDRDPIERWSGGNVVLLGDAAHAMIPYLGQGAAQALEDAVALGVAMDDAGPVDLVEGIHAYEEARTSRAGLVQVRSRANRDLFHIPDGLEQRERNARMARNAADLSNMDWLWQPPAPATRRASEER